MGVLYGRYDLLDSLTAYRVRPAPQDPPGKFEPGTGNFERMVRVGPVHFNQAPGFWVRNPRPLGSPGGDQEV